MKARKTRLIALRIDEDMAAALEISPRGKSEFIRRAIERYFEDARKKATRKVPHSVR